MTYVPDPDDLAGTQMLRALSTVGTGPGPGQLHACLGGECRT